MDRMSHPLSVTKNLGQIKAGAAGPTSNLHGCWNHGFSLTVMFGLPLEAGAAGFYIKPHKYVGTTASSFTECLGRLRPELLALHQTSMDVGTIVTECFPTVKEELLALHQSLLSASSLIKFLK